MSWPMELWPRLRPEERRSLHRPRALRVERPNRCDAVTPQVSPACLEVGFLEMAPGILGQA